MNKGKILESCEQIYAAFDTLGTQAIGYKVRDACEIRSFIYGLVNENKRAKSILGETYDENDDELTDLVNDLVSVSFAFGFSIANLFYSPYPKVKNAVSALQSLLKDEKLLPYFSKEKKAA